MVTLQSIHQYYIARIREIKNYAKTGDPWPFLLCASYIEFLMKLVYNRATNHSDYKAFIRDYLSLINSEYRDFIYDSGDQDLPDQMYHILRCGIIHSFSFFPDRTSSKYGARLRSILLAHRANGATHLQKYNDNGLDSVILTAEDFTEDLEKLVNLIFLKLAPNNIALENNIIAWYTTYTPINGLPK